MRIGRWIERIAMAAFAVALIYPLAGLLVPVGRWDWNGSVPGATAESVRTSIVLTAAALVIDVIIGTPVAWWMARRRGPEALVYDALLLLQVLMPPIALGILLSLSFGPTTAIGAWLMKVGVPTSNSATAFVATQVYASIGYYVVAARAALAAVPRQLEQTAGLLGLPPWRVFWRVTFPLARLGIAAAVSLAWVRALGEFGAVVITAYYPSGMPVQMWVNLQDAGLPAVMPLLIIFLLTALPLPWLIQLMAQNRTARA
jgi:molybdate/tungstate transport system permease protein